MPAHQPFRPKILRSSPPGIWGNVPQQYPYEHAPPLCQIVLQYMEDENQAAPVGQDKFFLLSLPCPTLSAQNSE